MHLYQAVTMPPEHWDAVAVLLLENARNLHREGHTGLLDTLLYDILPALDAVTCPAVRLLVAGARAELSEAPVQAIAL